MECFFSCHESNYLRSYIFKKKKKKKYAELVSKSIVILKKF